MSNAKDSIVSNLNAMLQNKSVVHKFFSEGIVTEVKRSANNIIASIDFCSDSKKIVINSNTLKLFKQSAILDAVASEVSKFEQIIADEIEAEKAEKMKQEIEAKKLQEEHEKANRERKIAEKYEAKKQQDIQNFIAFCPAYAKDEYSAEVISWLKENVTTISAKMSDYLDFYFVRRFGNVPHSLIDSKKKTSGGYLMQRGLSFSAYVKNAKTAPRAIQQYISKNKLSSVSYIWNLVMDFDFKFGKQN